MAPAKKQSRKAHSTRARLAASNAGASSQRQPIVSTRNQGSAANKAVSNQNRRDGRTCSPSVPTRIEANPPKMQNPPATHDPRMTADEILDGCNEAQLVQLQAALERRTLPQYSIHMEEGQPRNQNPEQIAHDQKSGARGPPVSQNPDRSNENRRPSGDLRNLLD